MTSSKLLVTADDFGASGAVNRAVLRAHREGILTTASLMVTGGSADEAAAIARDNPGLAVGLHLALSQARSILPPESIPRLVDAHSHFAPGDVRAALRYHLDRRARRQLRPEIEAQFEAFSRLGIAFSHVDGHQHLHALPVVLPMVVELARSYGAVGIRAPREPVLPHLRTDRSRPGYLVPAMIGQAFFSTVCRKLLRGSGLISCDVVIGGYRSGGMCADYLAGVLSRASAPKVEVYLHPSEEDSGDAFGPNAGDLEALLSPALRESIAASGFELTNYAGLAREADCEHA